MKLFNKKNKSGGALISIYLHLFKALGLERECVFTRTVFGPGLLLTRVGRHLVLAVINNSYLNNRIKPALEKQKITFQ